MLYALDRRTGTISWSLPRVSRDDGRQQGRDWRPLARSGRLLIAGSLSGKLVAYGLDTKLERWHYSHPEGGSIASRISTDGDSVYVPHFGGLLVGIGLDDGRQRWEIGGSADGFSWPPAILADRLYVAASHRGFFALPRTGAVQSSR
jgi:hypothetical protein